MNDHFNIYNVHKKHELVPLKRAYMEHILRRAVADRVSPYQYNAYGGSWIWLRVYRFEFTNTQVRFWIRRGPNCYPVFWIPKQKKDQEFLKYMGTLFKYL